MPRRVSDGTVLPLALDRDGDTPMHRQLYDQLRGLILEGRLKAGARLPSSRTLSRELDISRNTVTAAFDQLFAEGYLVGKIGAGSFVSDELPEESLTPRRDTVAPGVQQPRRQGLSRRGARLAALRGSRSTRRTPAFSIGLPDLDSFPFDVWSRLMTKAWRRPPRDLLAHAEPAGYLPLRRAIVDYLRTARGVRCEAEQVIVVAGVQQAIGLACHVLLDEGDVALMEEPGYPGVRGALLGAGVRTETAPVDGEGLDIDAGEAAAPTARLVCVAPSHQYPLGVTMTLARRLKLLDWAQRNDGWVLEDDYDSEYRYAGRPLSALQGLDRDGRVVYAGSFSKVMFPSLRIGYLVVPADLAEPFRLARAALDDHPSTIAQPALAAFIEDGHFAAHLRRMRKLYSERRAALAETLEQRLGGGIAIAPSEAGMHLLARLAPDLAPGIADGEIQTLAARHGVTVSALSAYYAGPTADRGLLLGYSAVPIDRMPDAVERLAKALET
ncbi:PLP-dependent aminotransferase family protein [Pacificispira sp.]|uniref:MocR-like pyridoxine biosynthesis transcription factor PdxR n=1 Tax=Pacificispira sp. TaxID=2888761 RepID=UPI003B51F6E9